MTDSPQKIQILQNQMNLNYLKNNLTYKKIKKI